MQPPERFTATLSFLTRSRLWLPLAAALPLCLSSLAHAAPQHESDLDFNRDIRPILSDKCYFCHGPDVENNKADLRLDLRRSAIDSGAIIPGDADASPLIKRITTSDPEDIMPPLDTHKPLLPEEMDTLRTWINAGAEYDLHWSYKRVEAPELSSIDANVREGLQAHQLSLSPEAEPETLLRRVYFDLIGLPPTPAQADAYLSSSASNRYEQLVDTLLKSPHFGENMATDWLDAVRYTDSVGYHGDQSREASPFRDYVIHAFNTNKPYDQFIIEQIAGDLLPDATMEQRVATGFNRLNQISQEGGIQDKEYIKKYQAERIRTASTALLGSTLACAECHDHKFDPFTAKDFYSFGAFFADILEKGAWTGNGSYQEADYQKYLTDPAVFEKPRMGPTLRVPNRTFLTDTAVYETERTLRLEALHQGTDAANAEFQNWLNAKQQLHEQGIPAEYTIESAQDNFATTTLPEALDAKQGYRFLFEANAQPIKQRNLSGFGILVSYDDAEYLFYWGNIQGIKNPDAKQKHIYKGGHPNPDQWQEYIIHTHELKQHRTLQPNSISLVTSQSPEDTAAYEFRKLRLETTRHQTPVDLMNADGKARLEEYLVGDPSGIDDLRKAYLARHANAPDQIELRLSYRAIDSYLNGTREVPTTISATPREIKILPRGNWMDESGEVVQPATPQFLDFSIASTDGQRLTRLDLAKWIAHRDNPLTARTYVNRIWGQFFGTPLSSAPEDLGLQGEYPAYPQLLDHLAHDFMESGWDVKQLVKSIVLSDTYRQTSRSTPELDELDPYNRLLARQTPRRLKAENIRDNALFVSDLLIPRIGGASAKPYQPDGYYQHLNFPRRKYQSDQDENQYRRGLYTHWQRTFLHPMLIAFDAPSRDECAVARPNSNTPLQALNQLNDPSFVEAAIALAHSLVEDHPGDDASRIEYAYSKVLTRSPSQSEQVTLLEFLGRERTRYDTTPESAKELLTTGQFKPSQAVPPTELAAWTSVTRALLNLHETITRY